MKPDTRPIIKELASYDVGPDDTRFDYELGVWRWAFPHEDIHEGMQVLEAGERWVFSSRVGYTQSPNRLYRTLAPIPSGYPQRYCPPWGSLANNNQLVQLNPPLRYRLACEAVGRDDAYFEPVHYLRAADGDDEPGQETRYRECRVDSHWVGQPVSRIGLHLRTSAPYPETPFPWARYEAVDGFGQTPFPPFGHRYASRRELEAYLSANMTGPLQTRIRIFYPDTGRYETLRPGEPMQVIRYPVYVADNRPLHEQQECL